MAALFAIFHDACRKNDGRDPEHGQRGAELATNVSDILFHLADAQFTFLKTPCAVYTKGLLDADITVQVCWDADRLDLGRVGITPAPGRRWAEEQRRNGNGRVPIEWEG